MKIKIIHQPGSITVVEPFRLAGVNIPAGFESNGLTVPRLFWSVATPFGRYLPAAIVHDYVFSCQKLRANRSDARNKFAQALTALGANKYITRVLVSGVALNDGLCYLKNKARSFINKFKQP